MIKRYDAGREYAANIGTPAITEQPEGAYVLYDDYAAVFDELRAEKAGLEAIVAAQAGEIERLRDALVQTLDALNQTKGPGDYIPSSERDAIKSARAALSGESNG